MVHNLVLCELYYKPLHGDGNLEGHYLVIGKFEPFTKNIIEGYIEYDTDDDDDYDIDIDINESNEIPNLENMSQLYRDNYIRMLNTSLCRNRKHTVIRNYISIISSDKYFSPQIAECIVLPTQETIAIIKTIWIKIIQRTWKKIFLHRKKMINKFIISYKYQIEQNVMKTLPSLKGMLCNLKKVDY
jgi:hypothetical protein